MGNKADIERGYGMIRYGCVDGKKLAFSSHADCVEIKFPECEGMITFTEAELLMRWLREAREVRYYEREVEKW